MSFLLASPEALVAAASDLAGIGSTLNTASAAAVAPTTGVLAAAEDEISTQIAALFSQHGLGFQQLSTQVSAFHDKFVQALSASGGSYATAEADIAQTLTRALDAPAAGVGGVGGALSSAVARVEGAVESAVAGNGALGLLGSNLLGGSGLLGGGAQAASQVGALLAPTGGMRALTAASALLAPAAATGAALAPAANALAPLAGAIENAYLVIEPYVQYGFELATYAAGWVPYAGFLAPQIMFFYNLFEPMVQSGLFNILDFVSGQITFAQGLSNFFTATTASINYFIQTEINWALGFLPPLPPLPPFFP